MPTTDKYENSRFVDLFVARQYGPFLTSVSPLAGNIRIDLGSSESFYQKIIALARGVICKGWTCVDVGCGPGRIIGELARLGGGSTIGLDTSSRMLQVASRILHQPSRCELIVDLPIRRTALDRFRLQCWGIMNAVLVEANAEEMPFGNAFADLICCANVLSRLANPDRCLRELHRILKPNGFVVMCNDYDWSADYTEPKYWFDDVREKLDEDYWSVRHIEENVPYTAWLHGRKGITALNQLLLLQKN